jgi:hypothetical protein
VRANGAKNLADGGDRGAACRVGGTDPIGGLPGLGPKFVGLQEGHLGAIYVGRFTGHAFELDDSQVGAGGEGGGVGVANVEAAEAKAGEMAGDLIDPRFQRGGQQVGAILKKRALAVVTGEGKGKSVADSSDFVAEGRVALEECGGLHVIARVGPDEFFEGVSAVARQRGKYFVGDGENAATRFARDLEKSVM